MIVSRIFYSIILHDFIILQVSEMRFKKFLSRFIITLYIDLIYSNTRILQYL